MLKNFEAVELLVYTILWRMKFGCLATTVAEKYAACGILLLCFSDVKKSLLS